MISIKCSTVAAFLGGIASVGLGNVLSARPHAAAPLRTPFVVTDSAGRKVLSVSDDPRSLVVYDTAEEEAVSIVATRNDASLRLRGARGGTEFSGTELKVFDVGAAPGFYHRAQLGKRKGGNYALVFTDPSGSREIAAIGESTERSGMAYVADNAGNELVRLDGGGGRPGVRILNAKGMSIAALAEDSAKTGALILSDASGNARVQAGGTDQGVGVVRALGPDSSKGGPAGLGLPGTYIVGKR